MSDAAPSSSAPNLPGATAVRALESGPGAPAADAAGPESILRRRIRKFRRIKRGYWSFLVVVTAYIVSFFLPVLANGTALLVKYRGQYYVPLVTFQSAGTFGDDAIGEPDYRRLQARLEAENRGDWVLMPLYPYGPNESLLDLPGTPPHPPSREHPFGTDDRGRDVRDGCDALLWDVAQVPQLQLLGRETELLERIRSGDERIIFKCFPKIRVKDISQDYNNFIILTIILTFFN